MPKIAKPLTPLEIQRLTEPGQHAVGEVAGLRLNVKTTGARSWVLRTVVGNRRAEIGLGGYPTVTLKQARERARETLDEIRRGADPTAEKRARRKAAVWTFKKAALEYIETHRAGWKNAKHADQWTNTLTTYAFPVCGAKPAAEVSKADVLEILTPIWIDKHETAARVRNRIELVLSYSMQRGYLPEAPNPARLKGNLDVALLASKKAAKVKHFEALPIDDMPAFMQRLRSAAGQGARALEFTVLTASRTGAVRAAEWDEMDLQAKVWSIPGAKMKSGRAHRVPLSPRAVELLEALPRFEKVPYVFPGNGGKPLSDMSLTACMRRMGLSAVPHGFRSTFSDWCAERTATPSEVREMALAHAVGDDTEAAYRRGDLFDKRRTVMHLWAEFINTQPAPVVASSTAHTT